MTEQELAYRKQYQDNVNVLNSKDGKLGFFLGMQAMIDYLKDSEDTNLFQEIYDITKYWTKALADGKEPDNDTN